MKIFCDEIRSFCLLNSCIKENDASTDQRTPRCEPPTRHINKVFHLFNHFCFMLLVSSWAVWNKSVLGPGLFLTMFRNNFFYQFLDLVPFYVLIIVGCIWLFRKGFWYSFWNKLNVVFYYLVCQKGPLNFVMIKNVLDCLLRNFQSLSDDHCSFPTISHSKRSTWSPIHSSSLKKGLFYFLL